MQHDTMSATIRHIKRATADDGAQAALAARYRNRRTIRAGLELLGRVGRGAQVIPMAATPLYNAAARGTCDTCARVPLCTAAGWCWGTMRLREGE